MKEEHYHCSCNYEGNDKGDHRRDSMCFQTQNTSFGDLKSEPLFARMMYYISKNTPPEQCYETLLQVGSVLYCGILGTDTE